MPGLVVLSLLGSLLYLAWFYLVSRRRGPNDPPGPTPLPLLGNLLDIARADPVVFRALHRLSLRHGPIVTLWMGGRRAAVVSGREELKTLMHDPSFDRRSSESEEVATTRVYTGRPSSDPHGILFSSGTPWREGRRFALRTLRDMGVGKNQAETFILHECQCLAEHFGALDDRGLSFDSRDELFNKVALNIIWQMSAGERYDYADEKMKRLIHFIDCFSELGINLMSGPVGAFPWLAAMPPFKGRIEEISKKMESCREFLRGVIQDHRDSFDEGFHRDLIDAHLSEQVRPGADRSVFNDDQLVTVLLDLFVGGSETTSKTLSWCCLFMAKFPEVQRRLQEELDSVVGPHEMVAQAHRTSLPYTEACLQEIWRLGPIGPLSAVRNASKDTMIGSTMIKKDTMIFPLLYSMTVDEKTWEDPMEFRPERHLNKDKDNGPGSMLTFGTGRRSCLGESLARAEAFLLFANLLHSFSLAPAGRLPPHSEVVDGLTIGPAHFEIRLERR